MSSDPGFTFDVVIIQADQAGITEDGHAVTISFHGLVRDIEGDYFAAVTTPSVTALVAALIANANTARAVLAGSAAAHPSEPVLACSGARIEGSSSNAEHLVLTLDVPPAGALRFALSRERAQALFSALAGFLAS